MTKAKVSTAAAILPRICFLRGQRVMLSHDLAALYAVPTKALLRAVRRHPARFPPDFLFQLTREEMASLRYQFGTLKKLTLRPRSTLRGRHFKYAPYAFTEHGVAMLSSVLHSERAVQVGIEIVRTFVRLRSLLAHNRDLARRLAALEAKSAAHDDKFDEVFEAIEQLLLPEPPDRPPIGFTREEAP